jgi:hypothetical protein
MRGTDIHTYVGPAPGVWGILYSTYFYNYRDYITTPIHDSGGHYHYKTFRGLSFTIPSGGSTVASDFSYL